MVVVGVVVVVVVVVVDDDDRFVLPLLPFPQQEQVARVIEYVSFSIFNDKIVWQPVPVKVKLLQEQETESIYLLSAFNKIMRRHRQRKKDVHTI